MREVISLLIGSALQQARSWMSKETTRNPLLVVAAAIGCVLVVVACVMCIAGGIMVSRTYKGVLAPSGPGVPDLSNTLR